MVSWIYSEPYIMEILTGVTTTDQNGRIAVKMVLVSRIPQKSHQSVYLIMEDILFFGFGRIRNEKRKLCHFENRRRFFRVQENFNFYFYNGNATAHFGRSS